jgi:hypothetical protein
VSRGRNVCRPIATSATQIKPFSHRATIMKNPSNLRRLALKVLSTATSPAWREDRPQPDIDSDAVLRPERIGRFR